MLSGSRVPLSMPIDVWREGRTYHVELDLPGVAPDDIDLQIERNTLTVTAQRRASFEGEGSAEGESSGEERHVVLAERPHGSFRRELMLGEGLDADGVRATYTDGVLRLTIPLAQAEGPRRIDVTTGGSTGNDRQDTAGTTGNAAESSDGDAQAPGAAI
jgi:HSP20 family protein